MVFGIFAGVLTFPKLAFATSGNVIMPTIIPYSLVAAPWIIGCVNIGLTLIFSGIAFHSKSLTNKSRESLLKAVEVHKVASLGFILLSLNRNLFGYWRTVGLAMLSVATFLFPGVVYYQHLMNEGKMMWLSK
jgi:hypothetical protein